METNENSFLQKAQQKRAEIDLRKRRQDYAATDKAVTWMRAQIAPLAAQMRHLAVEAAGALKFDIEIESSFITVEGPGVTMTVHIGAGEFGTNHGWSLQCKTGRVDRTPVSPFTFVGDLNDAGDQKWRGPMGLWFSTPELANYLLASMVTHVDY